jgi:hypothetical protein
MFRRRQSLFYALIRETFVRIVATVPAFFSEDFRSFPQNLQATDEIFLDYATASFRFMTAYHSTLCGLNADSIAK